MGYRAALIVVVAAGAARAQPAEPEIYVAPGVALGGDGANDGVFAAGAIEAGYRFAAAWWAFGGAAAGRSLGGHWGAGDSFTGTIANVRAGVEWHHSYLRLGAGAAFAHEHVPDRPDLSYDGAALLLRIALEFSISDHVHVRPATEMLGGGELAIPPGMKKRDYECIGVTAAAVYAW